MSAPSSSPSSARSASWRVASPTSGSRRTPRGWDREHEFPRALFAELGELGLMGVCVPAEHGGAGADFLSYVLVLEELSRADAGVGVTVAVHTSAGTLPISRMGRPSRSSASCRRWPPARSSRAFALTEPGAGSDAGGIRTRAVDGRITGSKQWCTNGSHASTFVVFARDEDPDRTPARSSCAPAPPASRSCARRRRWA